MMISEGNADAKNAYDAFASSYDDFNHGYMYERWTGKLLAKAEGAGLEGDRLLDVGCGTGLSFDLLLGRGWQVTGCDISPEMLGLAREKYGDQVTLVEADMSDLPALGEFDLVWSVNDAMNYLLNYEDFAATLAGMRRNLAPDGVIAFDVNTVSTYRTFFSSEHVVERGDRRYVWDGQADAIDVVPGEIFEARFEGEGVQTHLHRQRHFAEAEVLAAIDSAGLRCVEVAGELDGELDAGVDEDHHTKAVYVSCLADRPE